MVGYMLKTFAYESYLTIASNTVAYKGSNDLDA